MALNDWQTIQMKKGHENGDTTDDEKNAVIEHAVKTWEGMGLTEPEIAFGIAAMGLGSGFGHKSQTSSKTAPGSDLFHEDAWSQAVKHYNEDKTRTAVDPVKGLDDHDSQIRVMGPWIRKIWDESGNIARDRNVRGYRQEQIAYGKWSQDPDAHPKDVGGYLKSNWHDPDMGDYFDTTYDRAMQGLWLRRNRLKSQGREEEGQPGGGDQSFGEISGPGQLGPSLPADRQRFAQNYGVPDFGVRPEDIRMPGDPTVEGYYAAQKEVLKEALTNIGERVGRGVDEISEMVGAYPNPVGGIGKTAEFIWKTLRSYDNLKTFLQVISERNRGKK